MWSAIASFFLGMIGWVVTKLLLEPFKEIHDLRREAQECLIIYGDLPKDAPADDRRAAAETFRRIGAGLVSWHIAANRAVRWWCEAGQHWEIHSAGFLLLGIAENTQLNGFSVANASATVLHIRKCLNLPAPDKPPLIRALEEHVSEPGVIKEGDL